MNKRPFVYVASPYTGGSPGLNVHFQCSVFNMLMDDGIVFPVVPLWSHFQHLVFPRPYEDWLGYDLAQIERGIDAVLRLVAVNKEMNYVQAASPGADREVKKAEELGIPVFTNIADLYHWVRTRSV